MAAPSDVVEEPLVPESFRYKIARKWGFLSFCQNISKNGALLFYTIMLLFASVGNQVYFKRMTSAMPNYGWYLTQITTSVYIPFFLLFAGGSVAQIEKGMLSKFSVMGVLDGFSGTLMILGGAHTSGTMQVLLAQSVIPLTIIFSVALLNKHFHLLQHVGAGIIVLGIIIAKQLSASPAGSSDAVNNPVFNAIFISSMIPSALSSVFKEVAFRGHNGDLNVNVLQFWVAIFQVVTNFVAAPVYTLPVLGPQQVALQDMPALMVQGTRCLVFLENQVKYECGLPGEKTCDHCETAWAPVTMYLLFNILYNIYTMLVIKHGSAALSFLVATLRMPLASIAFSSPLIMGNQAVQPGIGDIVSLFVIIIGLAFYRIGGQQPGDSPSMSDSPSPTPSPIDGAGRGLREPLTGPRREKHTRWALQALVSAGLPAPQPTVVLARAPRGAQPRSATRMRHDLYSRLGAASPLNSPQLRHLSPANSPLPRAAPAEFPNGEMILTVE